MSDGTVRPLTSSTCTDDAPATTSKKRRIDPDAVRKAKAVTFLEAIMADLVESKHNEIKAVMRNVPDPYTGNIHNVVIREDDFVFWTQLLDELGEADNFKRRKRVVAIGTPGIGKSTTALFAIRLLLQKGKTVVYILRTEERGGYYIQFTPLEEGRVNIELKPEKTLTTEIDALEHQETYYLVNPGSTKNSCNASPLVPARVIIVASPEERHWGGPSFVKTTPTGLGGCFRYFPKWSLAQLEAASDELEGAKFQNGRVAKLYHVFGGVPRNVFFPELEEENKEELLNKINAMKKDDLRDLVTGHLNYHSGFGEDQPGGGIVEFVPLNNFKAVELKLASTWILKMIRQRFMNSIWTDIARYPSPITWQLLEDYMLYALQSDNQYSTRACVGKTDASYNSFENKVLGGCSGMLMVSDCMLSVLGGPDLTVFYSSDRNHPLYNMIYKNENIYYAFQITSSKSHDANQALLDSLVKKLDIGTGGRKLELYYAVHEGVFDNFVTNPVAPNSASEVAIFHLKLENGLCA